MLNAITISHVFVFDQNEALDFYVGKLGLEVSADQDLGFMRWLTVRVPGQPGRDILLEKPGPPAMDYGAAERFASSSRRAHRVSRLGSRPKTAERPSRCCSPKASSSLRSRSSSRTAPMSDYAIRSAITFESCNCGRKTDRPGTRAAGL
jgi:glyoxalase/bleomycin resistance protein/dioxygenase superfamily protein